MPYPQFHSRGSSPHTVDVSLPPPPVATLPRRHVRLRSYDSRLNVLDWDYTMELQPIASIVHKVHFREWRMTGLAFELRDSNYIAPNRSLASFAAGRLRGASVFKRGFWGDVINSPFAAVGVECDDERFVKQKNGQHVKTACDVAFYNVLGWLTALETGRKFTIRVRASLVRARGH
eukprot:5564374-Pleurochrysis_carterae.AAC.1